MEVRAACVYHNRTVGKMKRKEIKRKEKKRKSAMNYFHSAIIHNSTSCTVCSCIRAGTTTWLLFKFHFLIKTELTALCAYFIFVLICHTHSKVIPNVNAGLIINCVRTDVCLKMPLMPCYFKPYLFLIETCCFKRIHFWFQQDFLHLWFAFNPISIH